MNCRPTLRRLVPVVLIGAVAAPCASAADVPPAELYSENPAAYFKAIGKAAAARLPADASNVQRAKTVVELIGSNADSTGLYANVDLKGRARDIGRTKGRCGDWREHLQTAFEAAGIDAKAVGSAESYRYDELEGDPGLLVNTVGNVDVNKRHTSPVILENGKFYTFDIWQFGADRASLGKGAVGGVGRSKYNGLPIDEWIEIQKQAGRELIGLDDKPIDQSGIFTVFAAELRKRLKRVLSEASLPDDVEIGDLVITQALGTLGPMLLSNPQLTDEQIARLLQLRYFDVSVETMHVSKEFTSGGHFESRIGANDKPLLLRFRKNQVTADQEWVAYLVQKGENPNTVEWRFRWKIDANYEDGKLEGEAEYYYEGGIRNIRYPEWQVWHYGTIRGTRDDDTGRLTVVLDMRRQKALMYDHEKGAMVPNPYAAKDWKPFEREFEATVPVLPRPQTVQ